VTKAAQQRHPKPAESAEATRVWAKIGWLDSGASRQIALMHRELVEQRRWISDARFLHALSYCMCYRVLKHTARDLHRLADAPHRRRRDRRTLFVLPGVIVIGRSVGVRHVQQLPQ